MKKYIYIAAIALAAVTLTGCEDLLDSENFIESNKQFLISRCKIRQNLLTGTSRLHRQMRRSN
jgi:outer membrane lipoprotein SlyB